jgi:acyl carrier protein
MNLLSDLRDYIVTEAFHGKPPSNFTDDFDLIESGVMDSLLMMNYITWVSARYDVEFGPNDLVPKNFHSVFALYSFLGTILHSDQADSSKVSP